MKQSLGKKTQENQTRMCFQAIGSLQQPSSASGCIPLQMTEIQQPTAKAGLF